MVMIHDVDCHGVSECESHSTNQKSNLKKDRRRPDCLISSIKRYKISSDQGGWLGLSSHLLEKNIMASTSSSLSEYQGPALKTLRDIPPKSTASPAIIDIQSIGADTKPVVTTITHDTLRRRIINYAIKLKNIIPSPPSSSPPVIAIVMPNSTQFITCFLSITSAAYVVAPLNPAYTADEFTFYLQDSEACAVIICGDSTAEEAPIRIAAKSNKVTIIEFSVDDNDDDNVNEWPDDIKLNEDMTAMFLHTSGTTSKPKGVPLTHKNLACSISNIARTYELTSSDRCMLIMPLFHVHGLMAGTLTTLATGGCVIIPPSGKFSASKFWPCVIEGRATWYTAVPTMHQILLSRAESDYKSTGYEEVIRNELGGLKFIRSCSASLAPAVLERLEETFNAPVLEAYAMTEASHQMTSNPLPKYGKRKAGCVGTAQNVEITLMNDKNEEIVNRGIDCIGEVCIKGMNVTKGYHKNEKANEVCFTNGGWFHTGDQGWLDSDGYLTLTGRIKELVNRGGEKISPLEVDAALLGHINVKEAVAFAVPDEKYGEEINAAVILTGETNIGEDELKEFLKGCLAPFKIPKRFFICDDLPRTATGKIQRRIVSKHFLDQMSK